MVLTKNFNCTFDGRKNSVTINKFTGNESKIIIPNQDDEFYCNYISDNAFSNFNGMKFLKEVSIPEKMISIGNSAFFDCVNLEKVTLSKSIKHIGDYAFAGCKSLKSINLSETSILFIPEGLCFNCESLKEIKIPKTARYINAYAFAGCYKLETAYLPKNIDLIQKCAFPTNTDIIFYD